MRKVIEPVVNESTVGEYPMGDVTVNVVPVKSKSVLSNFKYCVEDIFATFIKCRTTGVLDENTTEDGA